MQTKIKTGIIGAAGYTGGELIRLLVNHPNVELTFVHSRSNADQPVYKVHQDLVGELLLAERAQRQVQIHRVVFHQQDRRHGSCNVHSGNSR